MIKNKDDFLNKLNRTDLSYDDKIEICQYYIDNYSVPVNGIVFNLTGLKINGGSEKAVDYAINQLKTRKDL
jgi:hypothetical protein